MKVLLKKKKKKGISIMQNVRRDYLTIEEIRIQHIKSNYWVFFKDPWTIKLASRINL